MDIWQEIFPSCYLEDDFEINILGFSGHHNSFNNKGDDVATFS